MKKTKLIEAFEKHKEGKFLEALELYKEIELEESNNANLMQLMGALYLEINELEKSKIYLIKSEKVLPTNAEIKNNISLVLKKQGDVQGSINYLKKAITCKPDYFDARYNLAVIYFGIKEYKLALKEYEKCEKTQKNKSKLINSMGVCYAELKDEKKALILFELAIKIDSNFAEAINNKANIIKNYDVEEALILYEQALNIEEKDQYIDNYIMTLIQLNRIEDAEDAMNKFYNKNIIDPEVELKKGVIEARKNNKSEALKYFENSILLNPKTKLANKNIGLILLEQKNCKEALTYFEAEYLISKDVSDYKFNKANALLGMKNTQEALNLFKECIEIKPKQIEYRNNLASALYSIEKFNDAIEILEKAMSIDGKFLLSHINLAQCYERLFEYEKAKNVYIQAIKIWPENNELKSRLFLDKRYTCDWSNYDDIYLEITASLMNEEFTMVPFAALSYYDDPIKIDKAVKGWIKDRFKFNELKKINKYNNEKIKIGYFSPDFRNHPVSYLISSLFKNHNREKFEVYAFGYGPEIIDYYHKKIIDGVDKFIDINALTDSQAAELGRELQLDIAIDLAGYTQNCRTEIFKYRVAPIQVSYLGFVGSMGFEQFDYLIADEIIIPQTHRNLYSEKIMYLEHYQCNDNDRILGEEKLLKKDYNLPEDKFIYCCFNNSYKISPEIFKAWMEILTAVEDSVLFLYSENKWQVSNLKKEAEKSGVSPDRLIFSEKIPIAKYLARFQLADLFLDTSPYNAGTTCSDALWAELPVLTYLGNSFSARMAASILNSIGLDELIAKDLDEYIKIAIKYGKNELSIKDLKNKININKNTYPIYNIDHYRINLENVFTMAYINYKNNNKIEDVYSKEKNDSKYIIDNSESLKIINQKLQTSGNNMTTEPTQFQVMNFDNPIFWGAREPEVFKDLIKAASKLTGAYHFADNMFVFSRNLSMLRDDEFMKSWSTNIVSQNDSAIIWRRYILAMAAYHCQYLEGDFVECGAYEGVGAKIVIDYLGGPNFSKKFWLYDIFEHASSMENHAMPNHGPQLHQQVVDRFSTYPNVEIIKGFIPESFESKSPEKIAYLHIDLNQAPAEIACLDHLFDKVVPGGIIIFDDYEMLAYNAQKTAEDAWLKIRDYKVFALPTSQGLVIKR